MPDPAKQFPDVTSKLAAPTKKSLFERQKAEAEAKRQKEQAETAAVYEDFVKSFDHDASDDDDDAAGPPRAGAPGGPRAAGPTGAALAGAAGPGKRHFTAAACAARGRVSGPGSLGPAPPPLGRKRPFDGPPPGRDAAAGRLAYDDAPAPADARRAFRAADADDDDDDGPGADRDAAGRAEQERAVPKPTLHLSSLPPGTSPAAVRALLPATLAVDGVRMLPGGGGGRRGGAALVALAKETPAGDLDTAVGALQNRYLGYGFRLSISRHLSSTVASAAATLPAMPNLAAAALPFGAKPITPAPGAFPSGRGAGGPHRGGFAPPAAFGPPASLSGGGRGGPGAGAGVQVPVAAPTDLRQLRLIHKTVEALLAHGPALEALLMARPAVQRDPRWAWLWDPRAPAAVYYRWRLWDVRTDGPARRRRRARVTAGADPGPERVFANAPSWAPPPQELPFEHVTALRELAEDSAYDSSDEDRSDDEAAAAAARRRLAHLQGRAAPAEADPAASGGPEADDEGPQYLNPLQRAKLAHLLARLPPATGRLRRGDVARVTAFAIAHAGAGADEVVALLVANIHQPFCLRAAAGARTPDGSDADDADKPPAEADAAAASATLAALYVVSDLLAAASTSGVRRAWRYRALLEGALRARGTFAALGRLERARGWGRLRADKWRRSVLGLLGLWEGWCAFPAAAHEAFVQAFVAPPLTARERVAKEARERVERERESEGGAGRKWKAVGLETGGGEAGEEEEEADGEPMEDDAADDGVDGEDVDGEPMDENEDVDGVPMPDEDGEADGEPMADVVETAPSAQTHSQREPPTKSKEPSTKASEAPGGRRRRPRAEDMFADSDGE